MQKSKKDGDIKQYLFMQLYEAFTRKQHELYTFKQKDIHYNFIYYKTNYRKKQKIQPYENRYMRQIRWGTCNVLSNPKSLLEIIL